MNVQIGSPLLVTSRCRIGRRLLLGSFAAICIGPKWAQAASTLTFGDLINDDGEFTSKARGAAGQSIEIRGYMAPPLKPEINFFVLTALPAAICPFCDSAAAWPNDIVLVQLTRPIRAIPYDLLISVTGVLDIGVATDGATGFVSKVRLRDARYAKA